MSVDINEYTATWSSFIQSLDVGPDKAKGIEQLPDDQKRQLLQSYTLNTSKCSAFHYVTLIKGLRNGRISLTKSRKTRVQTAKEILSATEISLRTNNVSWVYEFLSKGGLEALQDYMSKTIHILLRNGGSLPPTVCHRRHCLHGSSTIKSLSYDADVSQDDDESSTSFFCHRKSQRGRSPGGTAKSKYPGGCYPNSDYDSIHQGIKCYRALLNNQRGCTMTFDHTESINTIALCLFHPNFQTKTLVLELLAAVCLIVGGHDRVVAAFDTIRVELGESRRFESLAYFFSEHEHVQPDAYNIDFMVACMQFINIIVHSAEDINLRVFLQQEFVYLGLEDYLKSIEKHVGDRLYRQIEAYLNNHVDVAVLLEDSQAKDAYQQDAEALESELLSVQHQLASSQAEYSSHCHSLEADISSLQARLAEHEQLAAVNENEIKTLKTKLSNQNSLTSTRERRLEDRIVELEATLKNEKSKPRQSNPDSTTSQPAEVSRGWTNSVDKVAVSCVPPPPPLPAVGAPPPPPPLPGMAIAPLGSQSVPIRQPYQTRYKLPLMNWAILRNQQLRNTVFVGMNDERLIDSLNINRFEELFRLSVKAIGGGGDGVDSTINGNCYEDRDRNDPLSKKFKKPQKKMLMDMNRHRCIGILLRYLESEKFTLDTLWRDVTNLDISLDVADRILHQLPTQDETKMYLNYEFTENLPVDDLTDEDRLLLHLCKVSRLGPKLEVVIFMNTFDATLESLQSRISAVNSASLHLKKSTKFTRLLEIVLAFGNYMNSCRRGVAYGFRLQSLESLSTTRTVDKKFSLLSFIVETVTEKFPDLLNFYDELSAISLAAKVPMESLTTEVALLTTGMTQADQELIAAGPKAPKRLVDFVQLNQPKLAILQQKADTARSMFTQTTEWFGEAQNKPSPEQFFGCIENFIQQFKKAQEENEKRHRPSVANLHSRNLSNSNLNSTNASVILKKPKEELDPIDTQKRLAQEAKLAKRRFQNRTRQINGDGIMDSILAGLVSEPLQAEIHPRRN